MNKRTLLLVAFLLGASRAAGCGQSAPTPDASIAGPGAAFSGPISPQGGTVTNSATLNGSLAIGTGATAIGNYAGSACGSGQGVTAIGSNGSVTCGASGITNSAGANVVTKSDGTNIVASSITDNGTTVATTEPVQAGSFVVTSGGPTVTEGSSPPSGSCSPNGSVYLNTNGGSVFGCVSTAWLPMLADVIAATMPSTTTNDYNPTNLAVASTLALTSAGATSTLTGLLAPSAAGRRVTIVNVDPTFNIIVSSNSASSAAANRITGPWGTVGITLPGGANASVTLEYESSSRWRIVAYSLNDYPSVISDSTYTVGGASGPTWASGSSAPSGACTGGSMYSQTGSTDAFYICAGTGPAWVAVASGGGAISGLTSGDIPRATSATTLGNGSIADDGTTATVDGLKLTTCSVSTSTYLVNLNPTAGCTFVIWSDSYSAGGAPSALVGIAPPTGTRSLKILHLGGPNTGLFALNANATTTSWQLEGDLLGTYGYLLVGASVTDWTYDTTNSKWAPTGLSSDVGTLNVNGTLSASGAATFGGDVIISSGADNYLITSDVLSSGDQNLNIDAAGSGVVRFNSGTGGPTNSGTGGVLFDSGGSSPVQQAFIGSTISLGAGSTTPISFKNGPSGINGYGGTHLEWNEDWLSGPQLGVASSAPFPVVQNGWIYFSGASGSPTYLQTNGGATRPGVAVLTLDNSVGTCGTCFTGVETDSTGVSFVPSSTTALTYEWAGGFPTLGSTASASYYAEVGYMSSATVGCYFLYDPDNTQGLIGANTQNLAAVCYTSSGAKTIYQLNGSGNCDASFAKGTVTAAALTWPSTGVLHLLVKYTTAEADFYTVNGTTQTQVCKITTNIPTAPESAIWQMSEHGFGVVAMETDYTSLQVDSTSARSP